MKIAVIAAQGRSGQAFVQEALAAGHQIVAGIRGSNPFTPQDHLTIKQCDATDRTQVTELIERCDAVVSLIGHVKGSSDYVQAEATESILQAMEVAGVNRVVSLTGAGVWVPGDSFEGPIKLLNMLSARVGVKRFNDGIRHTELLASSPTNWTVMRVLLLTGGEPGRFRLKAHGLPKIPTPRREVARAILEVLEHETFIHEYPVVCFR